MRITTWNANSVRLREAALRRIVAEIDPDVLCLQETKVEDGKFPLDLVHDLGFPHCHIHGQKGYHGVAVLAEAAARCLPQPQMVRHRRFGHAVCTLAGGIELHNLYIPAGGDIPDPELNPKFRHKLAMLDELSDWFATNHYESRRAILLGDLNIAPLETDVWSHKQLLSVVSHTPVEVEKLGRLQASAGWVDAVRAVIPPEEKLFSWWSYRNRDWNASDRGRRLDHIWLTPALAPKLRHADVRREARGWEMPSDHVPVTVELAV
ncbi:MAG: exodeoxyribonuclease III [Geminicoccaceae bacterium]